jgi:hypothetical protein
MYRKSLISIAAILVTGVIVGGSTAVWGVDLVRSELESRVSTAVAVLAARRGWTVQWSRLAAEPQGIELSDLSGRGPEGSWLRADSLRVEFDPWAVLMGDRVPTRVSLLGVESDVDVRALGVQEGLGFPGAESANGAGSGGSLPAITIRARYVTVRGLPGLQPVTARSFTLDGRSGAGGRWEGSFEGWCAAGCGDGQTLRGTLARHGGEVDAVVELERPVALSIEVPGREGAVAVTVQRVSVSSGAHGFRIGLGEVGVSLPSTGGRRGHLSVDELELYFDGIEARRDLSKFRRVTLRGPSLTVSADATPAVAAPTMALGFGVVGSRISGALPWLERVDVEGGELTLADRGVVVRNIHAEGSPGLFMVEGSWAGGRIGLELRRQAPEMTVTFDEVALSPMVRYPPMSQALSRFHPTLRRLGGVVTGSVSVEFQATDVHRQPTAAALGKGRRFRSHRAELLGEKISRSGVRVDGFLSLEHGVVDVDGLAPEPLRGLNGEVAWTATLWPPQHGRGWDVVVEDANFVIPSREGGLVQVGVSGNLRQLEVGEKPVVDLRVAVEETDCHVGLAAIPSGLVPRVGAHLEARGRFAPEVELYVDLEKPRTLRLDFHGLPGTCEVVSLGPFSPDRLAGRFSQEVREGVTRGGVMIGPASRSWVPLKRIPTHVRAAMYLTEDSGFYRNKGFVPNLIRRALVLNLEKGRYAYGGSSLSQQLVKNLFLTREKTLSRKLEEALIVWRMESVLTKDRILELYINSVEFGPNIYGIVRASRYYFSKRPSELTVTEGLFVAALKPAPWQGEWFRRKGASPGEGFWFRRMGKLMRRLHRAGVVSQAELIELSPYVVTFN